MDQKYDKISTYIKNADAVLIGASNGLSISDGYHIFADNEWFQKNSGRFTAVWHIVSTMRKSPAG